MGNEDEGEVEEDKGHLSGALNERGPPLRVAPPHVFAVVDAIEGAAVATSEVGGGEGVGIGCAHEEFCAPK